MLSTIPGITAIIITSAILKNAPRGNVQLESNVTQ